MSKSLGRIPLRKRHLGWLVASAEFFILSHILFAAGLMGMGVIIPPYIVLVILGITLFSITALSHFAARTFAPYENPAEIFGKVRHIVTIGLVVIFGVILVTVNVSVHILGVPVPAVKAILQSNFLLPLSFHLLLYAIPAFVGWDSGRTKNTIDYLDSHPHYNLQEKESAFADLFRGKSEKKLGIALGISAIAGIVAGIIYDTKFGITMFMGFFGMYKSIESFYPDERE